MGNLKQQALKKDNEDVTTHVLTEQEITYLRLLNLTLQYHTYGQKIMSGFLYYISTNRLGYPHDTNLLFEIDLEKDDKILTVKLLSADIAQSPAPPVDK